MKNQATSPPRKGVSKPMLDVTPMRYTIEYEWKFPICLKCKEEFYTHNAYRERSLQLFIQSKEYSKLESINEYVEPLRL